MARAQTTMICPVPTPKKVRHRSPTATPTVTPTATSAARRRRWPKLTPNVMIAATGAKKGRLCPNSSRATNQASPAVMAVWVIMKARCCQRSTRRPAEARLRRTVRSLRSNARSFICCIENPSWSMGS